MKKKKGFFPRVKLLIKKLVWTQDSPQKIALGLAIGVFWGVMPTFGLAIIFSIPTAFLLRANRLAAIVGTFLSNPLTSPFLYGLGYWIGTVIFRGPGEVMFWKYFKPANLLQIGKFFLAGSTLLALGIAIGVYFLSLKLILHYRKELRNAGS